MDVYCLLTGKPKWEFPVIRRIIVPLSPESRAALDLLDQTGVPALDSMPPQEAQSVFNEIFKTQPEDQEHVAVISELTIPGPGGEIPARLYKPAEGELPVVMHFHGGGFVC